MVVAGSTTIKGRTESQVLIASHELRLAPHIAATSFQSISTILLLFLQAIWIWSISRCKSPISSDESYSILIDSLQKSGQVRLLFSANYHDDRGLRKTGPGNTSSVLRLDAIFLRLLSCVTLQADLHRVLRMFDTAPKLRYLRRSSGKYE